MCSRYWISQAIISVLVSLVAPTAAQPIDREAAAAELFRQGLAAVETKDCGRAIRLFEKSREASPKAAALYNIANCEEELGRIANALEHFQRVALELQPDDDRVPLAKRRAAALDARVPRLKIEPAAESPPFTIVRCDDVALASTALGAQLRVDPGRHVVTVSAPDRKEQTYVLSLSEGAQSTLLVRPGEALPRPVLPDRVAATAPLKTPGWILFGSGLFVTSAGVASLLLSLGDVDAANAARAHADNSTGSTKSAYTNEVNAAVSRANVKQWLGGCAIAAGTIAAGVGLYMAVKEPKAANAASVSIHVVPVAGGAGGIIGLYF